MYEEELYVGREICCNRCSGLFYTYSSSGIPVCGGCYELSRKEIKSEMLDMVGFLTTH